MNIVSKTTHHVDYIDVQQAIWENFGKEFDFVANEEVGNDSAVEIYVTGNVSDTEQKLFEAWLNDTNPFALMFDTRILFNKMASVGVIPKGDYVVSVSW